jgi:hypothetical protein|tara:strand:- start:140 stop:559 length:420 start_codon:yes stop_codon:yes gene_type:complete
LRSSVREDELDAFGDTSRAIEYFEMPFGVLHRSHHGAVAISQVAGLGENILVVELFREIPPIILPGDRVETIDDRMSPGTGVNPPVLLKSQGNRKEQAPRNFHTGLLHSVSENRCLVRQRLPSKPATFLKGLQPFLEIG